MGLAFDHHRRAPTTKPLQLVRWCARLAMPRGPGVPGIVPAEILDPSTAVQIAAFWRRVFPNRLPARGAYFPPAGIARLTHFATGIEYGAH